MILLENSIIPYAQTRSSKRKQKLNEGATQVLRNTIADNKLKAEEANELYNEQVKLIAQNFKMASGKGRRDFLKKKGKFKNDMKQKLFKESVYDIFFESLPLDRAFKEQYSEKLQNLCEATIGLYLEENKVTLRDLSKRSEMLESLINLCEETAEKMADEKFGKGKEVLNEKNKENKLEAYEDLDDEMIDDDEEEIIEAHKEEKEEVTISLAEEIKQTVIDTIQQEQDTAKELQKEKEDIQETLDATSGDVDEYTGEEGVDEEIGTPDATTAGKMTGDELDVDNSTDTEESDMGDLSPVEDKSAPATNPKKKIIESGQIVTMRRRKRNSDSLYRNIMTSVTNKALKENMTFCESNINLNMDLVMAESMMIYTLLETLKHTKILECNKAEMKQLSEALLHMSK